MTAMTSDTHGDDNPVERQVGERLSWAQVTVRAITPRQARRSRFVGLMKVALPLFGVVLLAVVIAWPQIYRRDGGFSLSFADVDVGDGGLAMMKARFRGVDGQNRPFFVTADTATQEPGDMKLIALDRVAADLTLSDGSWVGLSAKTGLYNQREQTLMLRGDIAVYSDKGYEFHGDTAEVDMKTGSVITDDKVRGQGPLGLLYAESMRIWDKGERYEFIGRVRTTIHPGARQGG
jgi:lipopolysaccharide export system protein LptC